MSNPLFRLFSNPEDDESAYNDPFAPRSMNAQPQQAYSPYQPRSAAEAQLLQSEQQLAAFQPRKLHGAAKIFGALLPNLGERLNGTQDYERGLRRTGLLADIADREQKGMDSAYSQNRQNSQDALNRQNIESEIKTRENPKPGTNTPEEQAFASLIKAGKSPQDAFAEVQQMKQKAATTPQGSDFEQSYKVFLTDNKQQDTSANRLKFRKMWGQADDKEPSAGGTFSEMKDAMGNPVGWVNPKTRQFTPVSAIPGAGAAAGQLSSSTRTMIETVPKVKTLSKRIGTLIDQDKQGLGPFHGRLREALAGKVGQTDPAYTKLRTDIGLLQTALMRMHVGARGGEQMMAHFKDLIDSSKQSPENLKAALDEINSYADDVASEGGGGKAGADETTAPPAGAKVRDYSQLK